MQNLKDKFATIYETEFILLTVGIYWVGEVSLRRHKLLSVYGAIYVEFARHRFYKDRIAVDSTQILNAVRIVIN